ncbi:MAG: 5-(carboxyamino)imidazole ribonucleotide mutase [Bdellovibrionales bacterium]|nr:5-(carboxyamino)imidazole ribonucleotide mutase [Bdellovibrionales bacterium]
MSAKVAIIMGSDSDWPVMEAATKALDEFGITYHVEVVSAHRTPNKMVNFAKKAESQGYKVIIAGAGGAAHLPGMVASATTLPVIGVPVKLKHLNGLDSLLSIAQMPKGVPVATMAIDNSYNAGLLAARILGTNSKPIANKLKKFQAAMKVKVSKANQTLKKILD